MKKCFIIVLLLALLTGCTEAQSPATEPKYNVAGLPITFGVSYTDCDCHCLQLKGTDHTWKEDRLFLNVDWVNQTLDEGVFGVDFTLEQWKNGSWSPCETKDDAFIEIACILSAGQTRSETYPITDHYALTEPGEYRIGATCYMEERETKIWLEFTVGDAEQPPKPEQGKAQYTKLPVKARYIRTDGGWDGYDFPQVSVIPSKEYLDGYYENSKESFYLERREQVYSDTSIGFLDACDQYDEAFFRENYLIFVILEEPSGSIRHEVKEVHFTGFHQLRVSVSRLVPEVGTDDMAAWHLILEIPKEFAVAEKDVLLYVDGTLRLGEPPELEPGLFMRTNPPKMQLRNGEGTYDIPVDSYYWDYLAGEDTRTSVVADANHPKYCAGPPFPLTDGNVELLFEEQPDAITVTCWPESILTDEKIEGTELQLSDNGLQLLKGGYVYNVSARWEEGKRDYFGNASYSFYVILQDPHAHTAGEPHIITGTKVTCGNTLTTVFCDRQGWEHTFEGDESVSLTQLLLDLPYSEETCRCIAEYSIKTDFGPFEVNLTQGFARCEQGQAQLTTEELEAVKEIIVWAEENAHKEN